MYQLLPMTRLGLESYQTELADFFKQLNVLLYAEKEIYHVKEKFKCQTKKFPEGHVIFPGSFIISNNYQLDGSKFDILEEGFEDKVSSLRLSKKIAFLDGKNCVTFCSDPFYSFFEAYGLQVDRITDEQVRAGILGEYELLIVPGGPDAGESYYEGLGEKGFKAIRTFVNNGGKYLGSCAGSYFPLSAKEGTTPSDTWLNMIPVTDLSGLDYWRTGTGFVRIEFEEEFHPITYGLTMGKPSTLDMIYWEGPAFHMLDSTKNIHVIARFKDFIASGNELPSWNLEKNPIAQQAMNWANPLTRKRFEQHLSGAPAIIESPYGKGHLVLLSPHAEFGTCGTEHEMKNNPNYLLLMNSIYYLSNKICGNMSSEI